METLTIIDDYANFMPLFDELRCNVGTIVKICNIHGNLKIDQVYKEPNNSLKGHVIRCSQCRLEQKRRYREANREKHRASASRARNESRKKYRELLAKGIKAKKPKANIWVENDRKKDPLKYLQWQRKSKTKHRIRNREREICRIHKITVEEYRKMRLDHNDLCAICGKTETRKGSDKISIMPLCIDHCHKKDIIRGLLCHHCNQVLGHAGDKIEILEKCITYLRKYIS